MLVFPKFKKLKDSFAFFFGDALVYLIFVVWRIFDDVGDFSDGFDDIFVD